MALIQCDMDGGSNKVIQQLQFLLDDNEHIKQKLNGLDMLTEQMTTVISSLGHVMRSVDHLGRQEKERRRGNKKKRRPPSKNGKTVTTDDVSKLLHLPTALQENILKFLENLSFNPTEFPDRLVENECLSEDECSYIRSQTSPKDQVRLLIRKIKARGPETINLFLEMVKEDQPHLTAGVYKSLERITEENKQKPICGICLMTKTVDLKDIADYLWKEGIITDDIYGYICEIEGAYKYRQLLWNYIINSINYSDNPETARDVLMQALEKKYNHIVQFLKEMQGGKLPSCGCICSRRKISRRGAFSSYGSTTSEFPKFDKIFSDEFTDTDSQSALSSLELSSSLRGLSFANLGRYTDDVNGNVPSNNKENDKLTTTGSNKTLHNHQSPAETSKEDCQGNRGRHTSGKFVPNEGAQLNVTEDESHQSWPFVSGSYPMEGEGGLGSVSGQSITRQFSNITICPAQSTTSSDQSDVSMLTDDGMNRTSESTDQSPSPKADLTNLNLLLLHKDKTSVKTTVEQTESADDRNNIPVTGATTRPKHPRRRRNSDRQMEYPTSDDEYDDFDKEYYIQRRHKHKHNRKRFVERQKSAPVGEILTQSRNVTCQLATNVGSRPNESRQSKANKKRAERRLRALSINEPSEAAEREDPKIPYNPTWNHRTQLRHIRSWDYNQARRYWLMSQKLSASERRDLIWSDTELKTDSDTVVYSDYTV